MKSTYTSRTGHSRLRYAKKSQNPLTLRRKKVVIERLTKTLQQGVNYKGQPLTEKDTVRIELELKALMKN